MGSEQNRLEEIKKFLSEILSGELKGYKIERRNEELFNIAVWSQKQQLITGLSVKEMSEQVAMVDFGNVKLTEKGYQVIGVQPPKQNERPNNVVPLNNESKSQKTLNINDLISKMDPEDQKTAQELIQVLNENRVGQINNADYIDFFNRNPNFYSYFISRVQKQPAKKEPSVPKSDGGIFSPEVQRIIAEASKSNDKAEEKPATAPVEERPVEQKAVVQQPVEKQRPVEQKTVVQKPVEKKQPVAQPKPAQPAPRAHFSNPQPKMSTTPYRPTNKKTTASVLIRYLDQNNKEIAPALSLQVSSQNSSYDVTSYKREIRNYNFVSSEHGRGTVTGAPINVIFRYEAKLAKGNIKVSYVDQRGKAIAQDKVAQGGHVGEFYPLLHDLPDRLQESIKLHRYILQSITRNSGEPTDSSLIYYSDVNQNFTAIFRKLLPGKITLRYRNVEGKAIGIGERLVENNVENGEQVEVPQPMVPTGYELEKTLLNGDTVSIGDNITVIPENQEIDYVFKRVIADGAIIFNYVDQDGREITNQTVIRGGRYGETYDFNGNLPQTILNRISENVYEDNPVIKQVSGNNSIVPANSITFDNDDHEYTAVYQATEAAPITLRFVTTDDNQIPDNEDRLIQGIHYYGDTFVIPSAPDITGFDLNRIMAGGQVVQPDDTLLYSNQAQTITYVYTIATSTITVHHVDQLGRQISEDSIVSGQVGSTVEQSQLVSLRINPYYVLSDVLMNNRSYTFTLDPQLLTFRYQVDDELVPDVFNAGDEVIMNALDTNGNIIDKITPNSIGIKPKVGHIYDIRPPRMAGYQLFSQVDSVRVVWNSEQANDFTIVDHPNGLAFLYQES